MASLFGGISAMESVAGHFRTAPESHSLHGVARLDVCGGERVCPGGQQLGERGAAPSPVSGQAMIIGVGVDLVEISRVRSMIASQGERALLRLFTEAEREYCADMANPCASLCGARRREGGDVQGAERERGSARHRLA